MVQHLGRLASDLPALAVHPQSVFLIVYPGGFCGEFLAWWLGLHPGCVRTQIRPMDNNRYVWQPSYRYEYQDYGTRDKLFLSAHPGNTVSKCGLDIPNSQQHIGLYSSNRYQRFFYYLYVIKTMFFEYNLFHPPAFFNQQQWKEFLQYLGDRTSFFAYEAEQWCNGLCPSNVRDIVNVRWTNLGDSSQCSIATKFDVGKLFFEDTEQESKNFCSVLNIESSSRLLHYLPEYHQRNVALVERYSGMSIDQFLDLDINQALEIMSNHQSFS